MDIRKALKEVAKQRGITVEEVRSEIAYAIREAWNNHNEITAAYQRQVPCKGDIPTPEELITYAAGKVLQGNNYWF